MTTDKDTVNVLGVRADGSSEVIGTAPMPPKMKARELVREAFGPWTDEDGSEADMAMFCCEQLITYMGRTQFAITPRQPAEALPLIAEMQRLRTENEQLKAAATAAQPTEAMVDAAIAAHDAERGRQCDAMRQAKAGEPDAAEQQRIKRAAFAAALRAVPAAATAAQPQECARPDIIERLTYHAHERDDLTLDDCLDYLAAGWKRVHGRTERQLVMQVLALLAGAPVAAATAAQPAQVDEQRLQAAADAVFDHLRIGPWLEAMSRESFREVAGAVIADYIAGATGASHG